LTTSPVSQLEEFHDEKMPKKKGAIQVQKVAENPEYPNIRNPQPDEQKNELIREFHAKLVSQQPDYLIASLRPNFFLLPHSVW